MSRPCSPKVSPNRAGINLGRDSLSKLPGWVQHLLLIPGWVQHLLIHVKAVAQLVTVSSLFITSKASIQQIQHISKASSAWWMIFLVIETEWDPEVFRVGKDYLANLSETPNSARVKFSIFLSSSSPSSWKEELVRSEIIKHQTTWTERAGSSKLVINKVLVMTHCASKRWWSWEEAEICYVKKPQSGSSLPRGAQNGPSNG